MASSGSVGGHESAARETGRQRWDVVPHLTLCLVAYPRLTAAAAASAILTVASLPPFPAAESAGSSQVVCSRRSEVSELPVSPRAAVSPRASESSTPEQCPLRRAEFPVASRLEEFPVASLLADLPAGAPVAPAFSSPQAAQAAYRSG